VPRYATVFRMDKKEARLVVRMPTLLAVGLRRIAEAEDRTVSQELRRLIRKRLESESARPPQPDALQAGAVEEPVGDKP
jgi:hypothetical protein